MISILGWIITKGDRPHVKRVSILWLTSKKDQIAGDTIFHELIFPYQWNIENKNINNILTGFNLQNQGEKGFWRREDGRSRKESMTTVFTLTPLIWFVLPTLFLATDQDLGESCSVCFPWKSSILIVFQSCLLFTARLFWISNLRQSTLTSPFLGFPIWRYSYLPRYCQQITKLSEPNLSEGRGNGSV